MARALTIATILATATVAEAEEQGPDVEAVEVADDGGMLPWTVRARRDASRGVVTLGGGYEAGATGHATVEARLTDRLGVRGGGRFAGDAWRPELALAVDVLRDAAGFDVAVLGGYEAAGFNTTPAVTARLAAARRFGETLIASNAVVGVGTEEGERYGGAQLGGVRRIAPRVHAGVDARFRIDLERDADEPIGEPDWELVAGPVASYAVGRYALGATAGVSARKLRHVAESELGAVGILSVAAAF